MTRRHPPLSRPALVCDSAHMDVDWIPDYGELPKRGLRVPLEGSEDDAVAAVLEQLNAGGATPGEAEVRDLVREARAGAAKPD